MIATLETRLTKHIEQVRRSSSWSGSGTLSTQKKVHP